MPYTAPIYKPKSTTEELPDEKMPLPVSPPEEEDQDEPDVVRPGTPPPKNEAKRRKKKRESIG